MGGKETMKRNLQGWGSGSLGVRVQNASIGLGQKIPVLTSRLFCCTLLFFFLHVYEQFPFVLYREGVAKAVFPPVPCRINCSRTRDLFLEQLVMHLWF